MNGKSFNINIQHLILKVGISNMKYQEKIYLFIQTYHGYFEDEIIFIICFNLVIF